MPWVIILYALLSSERLFYNMRFMTDDKLNSPLNAMPVAHIFIIFMFSLCHYQVFPHSDTRWVTMPANDL